MTFGSKLYAAIAASLVSFTMVSVEAAQSVAPPISSDVLFAAPNQTVNSAINYSISAPEGDSEVGLGLRVHFDSSKLSFNTLSNVFQAGLQPIGDVQNDTNNYDNDAATDKFFVVAWVDVSGNWPGSGSVFPLSLMTGSFTANANFSGSTKLNFTASSTSGGAAFSATSQVICRKPEVSLVAANTNIKEGTVANISVNLDQALPDECGTLVVNLGTSGVAVSGSDYQAINTELVFLPGETTVPISITTLNDNVVESDETLIVSLQANASYQLAQNASATLTIKDADGMCADIDGNGSADALTDGITLTRYLLGYRGNALIDNSLATDAIRVTAADIQSHIETYMGTACYDIDGNGSADALTDGILLIRYLSDYRGNTLVVNAIGQNATRTTGADVAAYIETIITK